MRRRDRLGAFALRNVTSQRQVDSRTRRDLHSLKSSGDRGRGHQCHRVGLREARANRLGDDAAERAVSLRHGEVGDEQALARLEPPRGQERSRGTDAEGAQNHERGDDRNEPAERSMPPRIVRRQLTCGLAFIAIVANVELGDGVPPGVRVGVLVSARCAVRWTNAVNRMTGSPSPATTRAPGSTHDGNPMPTMAALARIQTREEDRPRHERGTHPHAPAQQHRRRRR